MHLSGRSLLSVDCDLVLTCLCFVPPPQVPSEKVALAQKMLITKANIAGKFVVSHPGERKGGRGVREKKGLRLPTVLCA